MDEPRPNPLAGGPQPCSRLRPQPHVGCCALLDDENLSWVSEGQRMTLVDALQASLVRALLYEYACLPQCRPGRVGRRRPSLCRAVAGALDRCSGEARESLPAARESYPLAMLFDPELWRDPNPSPSTFNV